MKKKNNFIIGVMVIIVIGFFLWYVSSNDDVPSGSNRVVATSQDVSTGGSGSDNGAISSVIAQGGEILSILSNLGTVKLDLDFFESPTFKSLTDRSAQLPSVVSGRPNPFLPLGIGVEFSE